MFIEYVYLENFADIKEGTGQYVVELDFSEAIANGKRNYLLFGRNGSSKSTVLSMLHPFSKNYTDRDVVICKEKETATKVIIYDINGDKLQIEHTYINKNNSIKVRSHIYINGELDEATQKGDPTPFNQRIEELLYINKDFLKISRIGTDIDGFVELRPNERKNYIGKFMPEVDEWLVMYKNAQNNAKRFKQAITSITAEMDAIIVSDDYEHELQVLETEIADVSDRVTKNSSDIAVIQYQNSSINENLNSVLVENNIPENTDINDSLQSIVSQLNAIKTKLNDYVAKYENMASMISSFEGTKNLRDKVALKVNSLNESLTELKTNKRIILSELDFINNTINQLSSKINSSSNIDSKYNEIVNKINACNEEKEKLIASLTHTGSNVLSSLTYDQINKGISDLQTINSKLSSVRAKFGCSNVLEIASQHHFDINAIKNEMKNDENSISSIIGMNEGIDRISFQTGFIKGQMHIIDQINSSKCRDPICPHETIPQRIVASKLLEDYNTHQKNRLIKYDKRERILKNNDGSSSYKDAIDAINEMLAIRNELLKHKEILEYTNLSYYITDDSKYIDFVCGSYDLFEDILSVERYIASIDTMKSIARLDETIASHTSLMEKLTEDYSNVNNYSQQVESMNNDRDYKYAELEEINSQLSNCEKEINKFNSVITIVDSILTVYDEQKSLIETYGIYNKIRTRMKDTCDTIFQNNKNIESLDANNKALQTRLQELHNKRDKMILDINRKTDFAIRLDNMDASYQKAMLIVQACSPSKGIPLEFIREFLVNTENHVNELLDIAFDGDFRIGFQLSDTEFQIPITLGSGTVIPDINTTSSGQKSLVKTALSFAMIRQILGENGYYNIICLDEIDGVLDKEKNKERFVIIMEKLIKDLNIEQVFSISHNDNFHLTECGLILFPGHDMPIDDEGFMSNKIIVANIGGI